MRDHLLNTVHCMDCLEFMKELPDKCIDLTVTSPPYDNLRDYKWYTFNFEWIAKELYRITKDGGVVVRVVGDATVDCSETGTSFKQALYFQSLWFNIHDTMIYEKTWCPFPSHNRYYQIFEYMFVFSKWRPFAVNLIKDRENKHEGSKVARKTHTRMKDWSLRESSASKIEPDRRIKPFWVRYNIWRVSNAHWVWGDSMNHPAPFPEKLAWDHILSRSNPWDVVFDPFAWSWTTLKMALIHKRKFIWVDISEEYVDLIEKRLANIPKTLFDSPTEVA